MAFVYDKEAYDMSLFEAEDMSVEDIQVKRQKRKKEEEENRQLELDMIKRRKKISFSLIGLVTIVMIALIIAGQAQLTELNQMIANENKNLEEKQSLYIQTQMKLESKYSSDIVEEKAQAELGMSRADSYQKEYISLEDGDKAEAAESGGSNIFESIANAISDLWS